MRRELRLAARSLLRWKASASIVVFTLVLGTTALSSAFTAVYAVLLRPLPYADEEALVVAWPQHLAGGKPVQHLSHPEFTDWADRSRSFISLAAMPHTPIGMTMRQERDAYRLEVAPVSGQFFQTLSVAAHLGETIGPDDDRSGAERLAVLSYALWRSRFGERPDILGQNIDLDGEHFRIVGVMPAAFQFPEGVDVWTNLAATFPDLVENRNVGFLLAVGRLHQSTDAVQARNELGSIARELTQQFPSGMVSDAVSVVALRELITRSWGGGLELLLIAGAIILVIACCNVTALLVARVKARQHEVSVRLALGAPVRAILRPQMAESVLIVLAASVATVIAMGPALALVRSLLPAELPGVEKVAMNMPAVMSGVAITALAGLLCSILPMVQLLRNSRRGVLRTRAGEVSGRDTRRTLKGIVVAQAAVTSALLVIAGLLARSYVAQQTVDLGFDPRGLVSVEVALPPGSTTRGAALINRVQDELRLTPGVRDAAAVLLRPFEGTNGFDFPFRLEGQDSVTARLNPLANFQAVSPGYFRTMNITMREGRDFRSGDDAESNRVVIVSRGFAERYWPGQAAVGKRLRVPPDTGLRTVVGVAGDVRYRSLRTVSLDLYVPIAQSPFLPQFLVVRSAGRPERALATVSSVIRRIDPMIPVARMVSMERQFARQLLPARFAATVVLTLTTLAVSLAMVGMFGVLTFVVTAQSREIAVRMALGARQGTVRGRVLKDSMSLTGVGLALGLPVAWLIASTLDELLYGISAFDAGSWILAPVLMMLAAGAASYSPARRATSVSPAETLRAE